MADESGAPRLVCHSYTRARTFPKVIGSVAGLNLHTTLSYAQIVVGLGSFLLLVWSRAIWTAVVPTGTLRLAVLVGVPIGLGYAVRYARFEGRAPRYALRGLASLYWRVIGEAGGRQDGKPWHEPKSRRVRSPRVFVFGPTAGGGQR